MHREGNGPLPLLHYRLRKYPGSAGQGCIGRRIHTCVRAKRAPEACIPPQNLQTRCSRTNGTVVWKGRGGRSIMISPPPLPANNSGRLAFSGFGFHGCKYLFCLVSFFVSLWNPAGAMSWLVAPISARFTTLYDPIVSFLIDNLQQDGHIKYTVRMDTLACLPWRLCALAGFSIRSVSDGMSRAMIDRRPLAVASCRFPIATTTLRRILTV